MCRIAAFTNASAIVNRPELIAFLKHLEDQAGGHGNGIGGWIKGEPFIEKGVEMTLERCADLIMNTKWDNDSVIFHTRVVSKGAKTNDNCHPFHYGDYISCHNGTTTEALKGFIPDMYKLITHRDEYITDSEGASYLIGKYGFGILHNTFINPGFTGVFVSLEKDGTLNIFKSESTRDLESYINPTTKRGIIASSFPAEAYTKHDIRAVPHGFTTSMDDILGHYDQTARVYGHGHGNFQKSERTFSTAANDRNVVKILSANEKEIEELANRFFYAQMQENLE